MQCIVYEVYCFRVVRLIYNEIFAGIVDRLFEKHRFSSGHRLHLNDIQLESKNRNEARL